MSHITEIRFRGYKALRSLDLALGRINALTGPNNAGKSTTLSALRLLDAALSYARRRRPVPLSTSRGRGLGYVVPTERLMVSIANVHTDLEEMDTEVTFFLEGGGAFMLSFPPGDGCVFQVIEGSVPRSPSHFRAEYPLRIVQVPVLGPLEDDEPMVQEATLKRGIGTQRAARHFRNYWYRYPEGFEAFRALIERTWPGIEMERPELFVGIKGSILHMFCREERKTRELYWCGYGFQIWCQLLSHICRAGPGDVLIVDEPETYLHPRVQQQLLQILRETGAQVVLATHSATLIASAQPGDVLGIDRRETKARRYTSRGTRLCQELGLLPQDSD